jgi:uncharacterized protein (TIGR03437 family)
VQKRSQTVVSFLAVSIIAAGQPAISPRGIVNGASLMSPGLPAGSIAQGSLFTIFGVKLGPSTASPGLSFPLATTLNGVSVKVIQGSTSVDAIPVYVGATQINAIMPSNAPLGRVSIRVTNNGTQGSVSPATVVATSVGIFAANSGGFGPGVIQDFVGGLLPFNVVFSPATPGQTAILYATGLGPINTPDNQAPQSGNLSAPVEVFVGGVAATVAYHGRSSCCSGLDQINFVVPNNAPTGCWVPVQVRTNSTQVSNTVTMAISADGLACSDPVNALSEPFRAFRKIGVVALLHDDTTEDVGQTAPKNVTTDAAMLTFQKEAPSPTGPFQPLFSLPPAGTCTAYATPGDLFDGDPFPGPGTSGAFLDAGATFTLTGGALARTMNRPADNSRNFQPLGYTYTGSLVPSSLILNPGAFTVTGTGGADVGVISANVNFPAGLTWTNRDQTLNIDRTKGFTVNWSGAPAGQPVIIFGGNVDLPSNATSLFACVAPAGASSFTVPAIALGNVAPTRTNLLQSKGAVYVGSLPISSPQYFSATRLDLGVFLPGSFSGKTVIFQ